MTASQSHGLRTVEPGQVWRCGFGMLMTQYHVLAVYGEFVWVLRIMENVSAGRQPEGPETRNVSFFQRGDAKLWRDAPDA